MRTPPNRWSTIANRAALGAATALAPLILVALALADDTNSDGQWGKDKQAIAAIIAVQNKAWNAGSIDDFMQHYWRSEKLTFSAGGKTTRGWIATRDRYKKRYQTPEQMGQLKFSQLEFERLGNSAAFVIGRWQLQKRSELVGGNFSIVLRKLDGRWLIVHDHSSDDESVGKSEAP